MTNTATIHSLTRRIAKLLATQQRKVAFAESCTGGLVSGVLTAIPGISAWHCGGVVVYRNETKQALLKIPKKLLDNPGPVSEPVVRLMAEGVLKIIPEADISVAVTGHLGPQAPPELDGLVFLGIGHRMRKGKTSSIAVHVERLELPPNTKRGPRQKQVVIAALRLLTSQLEMNPA